MNSSFLKKGFYKKEENAEALNGGEEKGKTFFIGYCDYELNGDRKVISVQ